MGEKPILFSGPMVRAILEGRKTMTRRVLKQQPTPEATSAATTWSSVAGYSNAWTWLSGDPKDCDTWEVLGDFRVPYSVGDLLWVREAWNLFVFSADGDTSKPVDKIPGCHPDDEPDEWGRVHSKLDYQATSDDEGPWRPSIHMPRWASRITLRVTAVKVERLQDISKADVVAEGIQGIDDVHAGWHEPFADLWTSINGPGSWEANPWVAAYSFERMQ